MATLDKDYIEDPEFGDTGDPEYEFEMFRLYRSMECKPEALTGNPTRAAKYAEWLKTATDE